MNILTVLDKIDYKEGNLELSIFHLIWWCDHEDLEIIGFAFKWAPMGSVDIWLCCYFGLLLGPASASGVMLCQASHAVPGLVCMTVLWCQHW